MLISETFQRGLDKADWEETSRAFGLRSCYFLSATRDGLDEHLALARAQSIASQPSKDSFVVMPKEFWLEKNDQIRQRLEEKHQRLRRSLSDRTGTAYTVVVQLTDRLEGAGGNIAVHSKPLTLFRDMPRERDDIDDDYYDDENENSNEPSSKVSKSVVDDDLKDLVDEQQMDKGSVLIINAAFKHGFEPIQHGHRDLLVLEYWKYGNVQDTSPRRATVEDGELLGLFGASGQNEL
jgi:hypothetical protein